MPGLDGVALIQELYASDSINGFLPLVVLTADVTPEARDRALEAGAKDFLTKPFDHTEVILRVRNLLETGALYSRLERHNLELTAELDANAAEERAAEADRQLRVKRIDEVVASGEPAMVFQPIVDAATGTVVGAEALARFPGGDRPPNEWFDDAAQVGRGTVLELAAVQNALTQLEVLPEGTFVSVNVSPATATTREFRVLLGAYPPERLVVELTEHTRVEDYAALLGALSELRAQGVRIAVDDTGAGYAGLQHILRLGPDILKLDTALTQAIDADPVRRSLASALVAFGREVGAVLIAEGVETAAELETLRTLGVPWVQGYYLARPGPLPIPARLAVCK
jgi:EAL domain-containing protein (putative c-di-GMP-specific phosphodiesterase class I)